MDSLASIYAPKDSRNQFYLTKLDLSKVDPMVADVMEKFHHEELLPKKGKDLFRIWSSKHAYEERIHRYK